ncbi:Uncharacterised protein [Serratia quinivorans]|uniref:helix-turn-helix domain-containing protein n=1 Tax=Serratia quinivorans TaxID=137545 RepID=UPI00217781E1|nr:helix-turn-helix domain-containing protein [Serratia quinivorans]CAI2019302.1 Uncharacterised protein [Serratia quinivorans]
MNTTKAATSDKTSHPFVKSYIEIKSVQEFPDHSGKMVKFTYFAKDVYLYLLSWAENESVKEVYPSRDTIAHATGFSIDSVKRALKLLEEHGFITIGKKVTATQQVNLYTVVSLPEALVIIAGNTGNQTNQTDRTEAIEHGSITDPTGGNQSVSKGHTPENNDDVGNIQRDPTGPSIESALIPTVESSNDDYPLRSIRSDSSVDDQVIEYGNIGSEEIGSMRHFLGDAGLRCSGYDLTLDDWDGEDDEAY